jgi:anti-sigma B factor antagonist
MGVDQLMASVRAESSYTLVVLAGESDMNTRGMLSDVLGEAMSEAARHLLIDMSELEFIDSVAMHVLMETHARFAGEAGRVSIVAPHPLVARVLNLSGADQMMPVYPDLAAALGTDG